MKISLHALARLENLAGATLAARHLRELAGAIPDGDVLLLDFERIETVTSSYLKGLIFPFFRDPKAEQPTVPEAFPVLVGLEDVVREEIGDLAELTGRQFVEGVRVVGEEVVRARLHGKLDAALDQTLRGLVRRGAATATELHADAGGGINITAFNNRLSDLHARRLARRRRSGKQWIYEPIAREFDDG